MISNNISLKVIEMMRVARFMYLLIVAVGFAFLLSLVMLAHSYFKKSGKIYIETDRLILRKIRRRDKRGLCRIFSDKDITHFSTWEPVDREGTKEFMRETRESYKENGYGNLAVILKKTGCLIGTCGIHKIKMGEQDIVGLGCLLAKGYCGNGYGTEAYKAIRDYVFRYLQFDTVFSYIHPYNIALIRVAEKNGMRYLKEGKFLDNHCLVYGITRDEWKDLY